MGPPRDADRAGQLTGIGIAYDATVRWLMARDPRLGIDDVVMPVVGECDDGFLNDARGMHVLPEHVQAALDAAATGPVDEGAVGAGVGMTCHDFKGGIGTSSRLAVAGESTFLVGVLVLTNYGGRERLTIDGVPVGREITDLMPLEHREGSCIVVLATDAPLSSRQCARLARRGALGLGQTGSYAADGSGEIIVAFTTADRVPRDATRPLPRETLPDEVMTELFEAAVDATAEAVVNSLCMAVTVEGRNGNVAYALPLDRVCEIMSRHGRPARLPVAGLVAGLGQGWWGEGKGVECSTDSFDPGWRSGRSTGARIVSCPRLSFSRRRLPCAGDVQFVVAAGGCGEASRDRERREMGAMIRASSRCIRWGREQARYFLRKIANALLTIVLVASFNFFLFRVMPGNPARLLLPKGKVSLAAIQQRAAFHLNKPMWDSSSTTGPTRRGSGSATRSPSRCRSPRSSRSASGRRSSSAASARSWRPSSAWSRA